MMKPKSKPWKIITSIIVFTLVAAVAAIAGEETITGTLQSTPQGIVLSADSGDQLFVKGKDVSAMVGKSVLATGTVAEDETGSLSISITSIQEVPEQMEE